MKECKVHKFVKFDEDRIFCERCGLFMLAARQAPTYYPVSYVYPWWYTQTTKPQWTWTVSTGTEIGNTVTLPSLTDG